MLEIIPLINSRVSNTSSLSHTSSPPKPEVTIRKSNGDVGDVPLGHSRLIIQVSV